MTAALLFLIGSPGGGGQTKVADEGSIRLNQIGFYSSARKIAVVPASQESRFQVISEDGKTVHYKGLLAPAQRWLYSGEEVQTADFSSLVRAGRYRVMVPGVGRSFPFEIGNEIHRALVVTGAYAYEHEKLVDELAWAAAELFISTGEIDFLEGMDLAAVESGVPSWDWVSPLAWISLAHHGPRPPGLPEGWVERRILSVADRLRSEYESSAYRVSMGAFPERFLTGQNEADFSWGSNSMAA